MVFAVLSLFAAPPRACLVGEFPLVDDPALLDTADVVGILCVSCRRDEPTPLDAADPLEDSDELLSLDC